MNPRHPQFTNFYDDQVGGFRQVQSRQHILDRVREPTVIITVVVLLLAIIIKVYDIEVSIETIAYAVLTYVWDFVVFITPTSLLVAVDNWLNPNSVSESPPDTHAAKSEAMRRVFGLDRTGSVMESVFQVRSRALSVTGGVLGLKLDAERPAGLGNRDNSCYQNSILQGLASLSSFHRYLSACARAIDTQQQANDVTHTLRTLLADLNDVSNNGRTIWTPPLLKSMSTWVQQDAQEYFSKVLDDVDKSVARAVKSMRRHSGFETDSIKDDITASEHSYDSGYQSTSSNAEFLVKKTLRNPLEGLLAQRVACMQCGYSEGLSMIPFNCLTLSLGLSEQQHDLYERLDAYSKVEAIEGVECPKCTLLKAQKLLAKLVKRLEETGSTAEQMEEPVRRLEAVELALEEDHFDDKTIDQECKISSQAKVSTTKTKQIVIARPPQSLVIHVNRSVFDPRTFNMMKNSAPLSFPQTLDLGPWCLGSAEELEEKPSGGEQWNLDPRSSMIAGDVNPSRLTGPIYELRAAVTHYGRHENGHYICYRRCPQSEDLFEDEQSSASVVDEMMGGDGDEKDGDGKEEEEESDGVGRDDKVRAPARSASNQGWWRLSDHNVSRVDEDVVLSLGPGVFMLFYECVDPEIVLQTELNSTGDADRDSSAANSEFKDHTLAHSNDDTSGCDGTGKPGRRVSCSSLDGGPGSEGACLPSSPSDAPGAVTPAAVTYTTGAPAIGDLASSSKVAAERHNRDDAADGDKDVVCSAKLP